ncbi:MAG: TldD/PmbA family protein [Chloroflexi bacterium]|nr:TldD/PmbA family protein [Chloroflexota bacterium]
MTDYLDLAKRIVENASVNGVQAEAFIIDEIETTIQLGNGDVEKLSQSGSKGVGVRVIDNGRVGYAYTSDFGDNAIEQTWKSAVELASIASPDDFRKLPQPAEIPAMDLEIWDPELQNVSTEQKIELMKAITQAAHAHDARLAMVPMAQYLDFITHVYLANSNGFAGSYSRTAAVSILMVVGRDGTSVSQAFAVKASNFFSDLDPEEIGREAAERVVSMLGGEAVPTQVCTVVLDPIVAGELLGAVSRALTAESHQKGRSFLINKLGQDIASDKVTLIDNGRLKRGLSSAPFDGEGVPTSITRLIDEGVFQNVVYDTYTASKDGVQSTGNAQRGSHREVPSLGISNLYLQPGTKSQQEIISEIDNGMFVTRIMQTGGIDPITGDCSMGAYGQWIENGKLTQPVSGVTIATTLQDLLKNISEVGSDLQVIPLFGSINTPTLRVDNVTVGGTQS